MDHEREEEVEEFIKEEEEEADGGGGGGIDQGIKFKLIQQYLKNIFL